MIKFLKNIKALFTKSDVEKTSLQKTARVSIIFACIALVGVIVYFAVVAPLLKVDGEYIPELFDGEVYEHQALYILPVRERSEIKSIEIKNSEDHYTLNSYKTNSGAISFRIEGSEHIPIDEEMLSTLLADVRVLITNSPAGQERVTSTATQEDLAHYGLDEASDPAWFEVSLNEGGSYRIYIGNPLVTTTGYYVRLEGRKNVVTDESGNKTEYDIIYALQSSLSETVLKSSTSVVSLNLTSSVGDSIFSATEFTLARMKDGERDVVISVGIVDDQGIAASAQVYKMLYPKSYVINEDIYAKDVLTNLSYVQAYEIVAYGESIHDPDVYKKFALDLDNERLDTLKDENYAFVTFNCSDINDEDYENKASILYFSEKQTDLDGTEFYYVYAPAYEIVGKVLAEQYGFIDWKLANFTSPYLFFEYFTSTEVIDIVTYNRKENLDLCFLLSGKERSRRVDVMTSSSGGKTPVLDKNQQPLFYKTQYVSSAQGQYEGDFEIFRDLFYVLITRQFALYAEIDESTTFVGQDMVAKLAITTSLKDHPISYSKYDEYGNKVGNTLRDEGGNILCSKVMAPTSDGNGYVEYDRAYYDIAAKRFFLKSEDPNDGNIKPNGFGDSGTGTVKVTLHLPEGTTGEYTETTYVYEFYNLYDRYVNANGETVEQLNPTYTYVLPSIITRTYKLGSNGEKELLTEEKNPAEEGVYIRTATINKLFSDTDKLMKGEAIDKMGVN